MQSTLHPRPPDGLHVGIIMDGNGRWAESRGQTRSRGHIEGARVARAVVEGAPSLGVGVLTLYAFSADNWKRPSGEVRSLMRLLRVYLRSQAERCIDHGIRVEVIGRRDRLPPLVVREIVATEGLTARGDRLLLRLAIDYSARDALLAAALAGPSSRREFDWNLDRAVHAHTPVPDVDLVLRTGGERRLSDFMLWESAYAELVFTDVPWPAFSVGDLTAAIREFHQRDRRFGAVTAPLSLSAHVHELGRVS
ncbi:MAG: polyprenyl diphosphate synthase [marine benthic group bacterium]|nr:polyprenyl diphosphate synthase [Candidatus Benthicola marisminoris]